MKYGARNTFILLPHVESLGGAKAWQKVTAEISVENKRPRPEPSRCLGATSVRSWPPALGIRPLSLEGLCQTDLGHIDVSQWAVDPLQMSALGQKQTFSEVCAMSALPPKADIAECDWRGVPIGDSGSAASESITSLAALSRRLFPGRCEELQCDSRKATFSGRQ